ncbi:MAG: TorF family putative porin [Pseudomonadota bacterium]|nr:TorF family putative porin [Pseudomonadota bacterium]
MRLSKNILSASIVLLSTHLYAVDFSGTAGLGSNYIFRGLSLSDAKSSGNLGFNIGFDDGMYFSTDFHSTKISGTEFFLINKLGYKTSSYEFGYTTYEFYDDLAGLDDELYFSATKGSFGLVLTHNFGQYITTASKNANILELSYAHPLSKGMNLSATIGGVDLAKPDGYSSGTKYLTGSSLHYGYGKLCVSKDFSSKANIAACYSATDVDAQAYSTSWTGEEGNDQFFVNASFTF